MKFAVLHKDKLKKHSFNTSFGLLVSVADDNFLYLLQFADSFLLNRQINQLEKKFDAVIVQGYTQVIEKIELELMAYCQGTLKKFTTPILTHGTNFQRQVWDACSTIQYGKRVSYQDLAQSMDNALAVRAVGAALGSNCHVIIVPCHRITRLNGTLGGYAGGVGRKSQLLIHEQLFQNKH